MAQFKIKKILVPIDFSFTSLKALDHATTMAKIIDAEITLLHVVENQYVNTDPLFVSMTGIASFEDKLNKISMQSLGKLGEKIKKKGVKNIKLMTVNGRTHKEILSASKKIKADMIVMGTHGVSGVREFVIGSNTFRIVNDSGIPVLSVQRKGNTNGFKTILVPFSDRPHSREKVIYAIRMAEMFNSTIHVLGIDIEGTPQHEKKIKLEADQICKMADRHNLASESKVIAGSYDAQTVLDYSKKINADLILSIGDIDKEDLTEYFTGSFAQQLINHSPVPVLSVHSKLNPKMIELWHGI